MGDEVWTKRGFLKKNPSCFQLKYYDMNSLPPPFLQILPNLSFNFRYSLVDTTQPTTQSPTTNPQEKFQVNSKLNQL